MVGSGVKSPTTPSGSNFHREIIKKYQNGKIGTFRFPWMIFHENIGNFLHEKINLHLLFQLYITNKTIVPSFTVKILPETKRMISWFNTKNDLQSVMKLKNVQNVNNETNVFPTALKFPWLRQFTSGLFPIRHICANRIMTVPLLRSLFFKAETVINESNKLLRPLFLAIKTAYYQQATYPVSSDISILNPQILKHSNYMQILNLRTSKVKTEFESVNTTVYSTTNEKERFSRYQFSFDRKSPAILSQSNLLFNHTVFGVNRLFFENSNLATVNKPWIQTNYFSFGHGVSNFSPRSYAYNADGEKLHLCDTKHIEQEIENIKKIAIETKESVLEKSKSSLGEADIKRYIDINRISDQVYQNIERTIRMERERRGM